jgi:hypothetical protein
VLALLLSWERKARRLLREGRAVEADITESRRPDGASGDARATEVHLVLPLLPGAADTDERQVLTAIRPPAWIGETETVIYDPLYPDRAIALGDIPGDPRIDEARNTLRPSRFPLLHFLLPGIALGLLVTLGISIPLAL